MRISPKKLYPTESLSSIKEDVIRFFMECYKNNIGVPAVVVLMYDGDYYIIDGHQRMLAANRLKLNQIDVEQVQLSSSPFWSNEENILYHLKAVGRSTLYDFEAVGDFTYEKYPSYYSIRE